MKDKTWLLRVSPHLSPRRGHRRIEIPLSSLRFVGVLPVDGIPDFGRFYRLARPVHGGCRARRKPPSSLTRKRVHGRTGFTGKGQKCPLRFWTGVTSWRGSKKSSLAGYGLCQHGTTVWTGSKVFPLSRERQRLESFLRRIGNGPASAPLNPPRAVHPSRLETSQDFGARNERASRCGLSSRYSETRSRSLDPLIRVLGITIFVN
jgi:hypothetical protein